MNRTLSRLTRIVVLAGMIAPLSAQDVEKKAPVTVDPAPVSRQAGVITSFAPIVEKVSPSVVQISTTKTVRGRKNSRQSPLFNDPLFRRYFGIPDSEDERQEDEPPQQQGRQRGRERKEALGLGSGIIVSKDGHILTNNHVIEGADDILVTLAGDKKEYTAKKIGTDPGSDLAVLKLDVKDVKELAAITFADSDKLRVGDFAIAIGNPFGLKQSVTMGIVSSMGRNDMDIVPFENFIQTDASINPGNSGGPLVDIEGRLIGVNTAIFSRTGTNMGIGFAVPANMARSIMDSILQHGRVVRGYLGVTMQNLDQAMASKFKVKTLAGVLVNGVQDNSPAAQAGIESGDVITAVDGKSIDDMSTLRMTIGGLSPGAKVELSYLRNGEANKALVTLTEREPEDKLASNKPQPQVTEPDVLDGVMVDDLSEVTRKKYSISESAVGVVVTEIQDDCPSAAAGLRVGDVIQSIERTPIKTAKQAEELSNKLKSEKEVLLHVSTKGVSRYLVIKEE